MQLPPLVFQELPTRAPAGSATPAQSPIASPNWSTAGLARRLFLVLVLLAEVAAVTLAIAGEVGALQA